MKIKVTEKNYEDVVALPKEPHIKPAKQTALIRKLIKTLSINELKAVNFSCSGDGLHIIGRDQPALILMNHSSFTDLQIAGTLLSDRQYHIVMTNDGMIGKEKLMRMVGCIPTKKFITDTVLVRDMVYTVKQLKSSILMYPEASYSFDGTETPLPSSLGKCIKLLKIPVIMIKTQGAFLRDPLYNNLQKRKVDVSATVECILTIDDIQSMSAEEINSVLADQFSYDHFDYQIKNNILITEDFRADGLDRVLYKCPKCSCEGKMVGKGVNITCSNCGDTHVLTETGTLENINGTTSFTKVTDWYRWQRECVKKEIKRHEYYLELEVDIMMLVDSKSMYRVGEGKLIHNYEGFHLTGCDGKLNFSMAARASYSLYSDYFWYEIGDVIAIGDNNAQYYCFPKMKTPVAKARLATEELYKLLTNI